MRILNWLSLLGLSNRRANFRASGQRQRRKLQWRDSHALYLESLEDRTFLSATLQHTLLPDAGVPQESAAFGSRVAASTNYRVVGVPNADVQGVSDSGQVFVYDATTGNLLWTLNNPTPAASDNFGYSVAVSGNTVVVGAWFDDTGATNAGSAYVFDATTGNLLRTLNNPTPATFDNFGNSVAVSGNTMVVGANRDDTQNLDQGAAYVFTTNLPPVDILLSNPSVDEGIPTGTPVGTLSATDPDSGNTFTFSLVAGTGDTDNARFVVVGNTLKIISNVDFETQNSYAIRVQVADQDGLTFEKQFTINVTNVNEVPVATNGSLSTTQGIAKNGTLVVTDVDSAPAQLTISVVSGPSHGSVVITDIHTGAYTYTPTAGYTGPDSFTFKANDGSLNSNTATVSVVVSTFTPPPPIIIDNAAASGYSETGSWKNKATSGPAGYLGDLRYAHPNATIYSSYAYDNGVRVGSPGDVEFATANVDTATFTFTNLPAGTYQIGVTYKAATNRATNASFTVSGTGVAPETVQINQRLNPSSFTTGTPAAAAWQTLVASYGSISANGTITVTLTSAGANGYVIADAVVLRQIAPLEAESGAATNPVEQSLSARDLQRAANQAIDRWKAAGLTSSQLGVLNNVQFAVQDLPGGQLGVQASNLITIDPNAAGYGWFIDSTLRNDREFSSTSSLTELEASPGSPAFGKMDLLTVVMHELGHVLGLDHSNTPFELMTDTMGVGIRRIPSVAQSMGRTPVADRSGMRTASKVDGHLSEAVTEIAVGENRTHDLGRIANSTQRTSVDFGNDKLALNAKPTKKQARRATLETTAETTESNLDQVFTSGWRTD